MNAASALDTNPDLRSLRFRERFFFVRMWLAYAWLRLILPVAVFLNRLAAPRCDFAFLANLRLPFYECDSTAPAMRSGAFLNFTFVFRGLHFLQHRFARR